MDENTKQLIRDLIEVYECLLEEHRPAMEEQNIIAYPDIEDIIDRAREAIK